MDETVRDLERRALTGDSESLEKLRAAWVRQAQGIDIGLRTRADTITVKEPLTWRMDQIPGTHVEPIAREQGFYIYATSVIPDLGQPIELLRRVWNDGRLEYEFSGGNVRVGWPMRLVMPNPDVIQVMFSLGAEKALELLMNMRPMRDMTVESRPLFLGPCSLLRAHMTLGDYRDQVANFECLVAVFGVKVLNVDTILLPQRTTQGTA